jgi:hypothetical protein
VLGSALGGVITEGKHHGSFGKENFNFRGRAALSGSGYRPGARLVAYPAWSGDAFGPGALIGA